MMFSLQYASLVHVLSRQDSIHSKTSLCRIRCPTSYFGIVPNNLASIPKFNCTYWSPTAIASAPQDVCLARLCPVPACFGELAFNVTTWPIRQEKLCSLALDSFRKQVKVMNLGGSMTAGSYTRRSCCCAHEMESQCSVEFTSCKVYKEEDDDNYCAWPGFFFRYLEKAYPNKSFQFVSNAYSGCSSYAGAYDIEHWLITTQMTSNDVIFIDYSVNDAAMASDQLTRRSLEMLIRVILRVTASNLPSIVIIEQYSHIEQGSLGYPSIYREIARHYSIPLWSYRDANRSTCATGRDKDSEAYFSSVIKAQLELDYHPSWVGYLYIADVLARAMELNISACPSHAITTIHEEYIIPEAMYSKDSTLATCTMQAPLLVNAHASSSLRPHDLHTFELNASAFGWREYIDHHVPGWIISKHSNASQYVLSFPFATLNSSKRIILRDLAHIVLVSYLQTYNNAGEVDVFLCGVQVGTIDSLARNIKHKISIPVFCVYGFHQIY